MEPQDWPVSDEVDPADAVAPELAAVVRAEAEADRLDWAPGQVLGYSGASGRRARGQRKPGNPAMGVAALAVGSFASAAGLMCLPAAAVVGEEASGLFFLAALFAALTAVGLGTAARRGELSRKWGTVGRLLGLATPLAVTLPAALVGLVDSLFAAVFTLMIGAVISGVLTIFVTAVLDPMFQTE